MMLVDDRPRFRKRELRAIDGLWREQVTRVVERFSCAFPEIEFQAGWNVDAFNGQAWREKDQAHVALYGGLLRHKHLGIEAIALLFAHETGHHLGGGRRDTIYSWMSCERQADLWAAHGVRIAWAEDPLAAARIIVAGAKQVLKFEQRLQSLNPLRQTRYGRCLDHGSPEERHASFMEGLSRAPGFR